MNKEKGEMYRQGDLLFIRTDKKPAGRLKTDLVVLGSAVTGHDHALTAGKVWDNTDQLRQESWNRDRAHFYIEVPINGSDLVHPEHKTIPLPGGIYEVIRQREINGYVQD